jgi:predicted PurR-regulated permease PerM
MSEGTKRRCESEASGQDVARTIRIVAWTALGLIVLYALVDLFLLAFAAVLLAVVLDNAANALSRQSSVPRSVALAAIIAALFGGMVLAGWLLAPSIAEQSRQFYEAAPELWGRLNDRLGGWIDIDLTRWLPVSNGEIGGGRIQDALRGLLGAVSGTLGVLGSVLLVVVMAVYIAADFETYREGALKLLPGERRGRARHIVHRVEQTLQWWMIGKLISMFVVGVLTYGGLWLLDMPMAAALAVIAGALAFIPNFGPIIAAVPAVLVALGVSPGMMLYVIGLYVAVQTVESYTITPLIQQKTVLLPPALSIFAQLVMGTFAAGIGLAMATPLVAIALVLVREIRPRDA